LIETRQGDFSAILLQGSRTCNGLHRFVKADRLELRPAGSRWLIRLIEQLWADQAVGIVGDEPKCGKSFLALDVALAGASGPTVEAR
jgi:hypothetical protein